MKIIIVNLHPQDALGGSEIQCDIFAKKLTELGHNVIYLAINGKGEYKKPYTVIPTDFCSKIIAETTIKENPDIVYWRINRKKFRNSVKPIKKAGIKIVFAFSSNTNTKKWLGFGERRSNESIIRYIAKSLIRNIKVRYNHTGLKWVDGITVNNESHLNKLNFNPQIYIPNSNIIDFVPFSWKKPFICWVANLKTNKRPELCLELAKMINNQDIDILIVGKIQDSNYLYFRNKNNLTANLYYLGPKTVTEVNGIIKSSICLIHTCKTEGFPGNFIQAWLQGKPVVSYEYDPGELIRSEELGFVSDGDMDNFANDVKKLIEDEELRNTLGKRAQLFANKNFHPETNTKKLESFLKDIVNNKRTMTENIK